MKVYIVMEHDYESSYVLGVYDSMEAVARAHPGDWRHYQPKRQRESWVNHDTWLGCDVWEVRS